MIAVMTSHINLPKYFMPTVLHSMTMLQAYFKRLLKNSLNDTPASLQSSQELLDQVRLLRQCRTSSF